MKAPRSVAPWTVAVALAMVGAALLVTTYASRRSVGRAATALDQGQADAVEQKVRADLADLGGPPTAADLEQIVRDYQRDGLRYLAIATGPGRVLGAAGTPVGSSGFVDEPDRVGPLPPAHTTLLRDRVRVESYALFRRAWGPPRARPVRVVIEVEPTLARSMRRVANRNLGIGAIAGLVLLTLAGFTMRWVLRQAATAEERERERRLASLGQLSAVLAHELRNPLASLKGNAQLLAAGLPPDDRARGKADRVVAEAVRLERLTNDLLTFVRTGEVHRAPIAPATLLAESAAAVSAAIEVDASAAPATWMLDGDRMRNVLVNVLDNAVAAGLPARARVFTERGRLVFEVADAGPGLPPDDPDRVFEPFYTHKAGGTGLGLALARHVVTAHRGTITARNGAGGGAVFRIEIPDGSTSPKA